MKKIYLLILIALLSATGLIAQEPGESIFQPKNVIGRKLDATNSVTYEYEASFSYASDGKLSGFQFPEWGVSSAYNYENEFLMSVSTQHNGMWPYYSDILRYTYEDERVKTEAHLWDAMNADEFFQYDYYEDGRLYKKYYAFYDPEDRYAYSTFEYENEGKTRIESYYARTFQGTEIIWRLDHRTVCQYDNYYVLFTEQTDKYNVDGEITSSKRKNYTYTPDGQLETEVSQTLVENNWENSTIHRYIYDEEGNLTEQQDGAWSTTLNDWNISKKIVHEYSQKNMTYTVSFYKKSGDVWVWDIFNSQKLFFEPELKRQQQALNCFAYEDLLGSALVNRFEFEMINTKLPTYASVSQIDAALYGIYPNPGKGGVTIKAPVENAVIRFYDLQGRLMLAKPFDFSTTVGTSSWASGMYIWELWDSTQKQASGKWIKE